MEGQFFNESITYPAQWLFQQYFRSLYLCFRRVNLLEHTLRHGGCGRSGFNASKTKLTKLLNPRSDCGDPAFTLPLRAWNYWPPVPVPLSYESPATLNKYCIGNKLNSSGKLLFPEAHVTSNRQATTHGCSYSRGGRAAREFGRVECVD